MIDQVMAPRTAAREDGTLLQLVPLFMQFMAALTVEGSALPVTQATLVLYGRPDGKNETEIARLPMSVEGTRAAGRFDLLPPSAVAYRVHVVDENGFANANPPRRGIASGNYKAPSVKLLAANAPGDEYDHTGPRAGR